MYTIVTSPKTKKDSNDSKSFIIDSNDSIGLDYIVKGLCSIQSCTNIPIPHTVKENDKHCGLVHTGVLINRVGS